MRAPTSLISIVIIGILITVPATASPTNVRELVPGAKSPSAKIESLTWMAGRWMGDAFGGQVEENFSPPVGGVMVGHFSSWQDGKISVYELETVGEEKGTLVFRLKHFNPDLKGWEEKDKTVDFPLVAIEGNRIYFDGLTIERTSADEMRHFVALKDKNGKMHEEELVYRRVK